MIEFDPSGRILDANANYLRTMGYELAEIKGRHHSMFVDAAYARSDAYKAFWADLRAGTYQARQFKRLGKGGREVWIEASYNPVLNRAGRPLKIVKIATDVTAQKLEYADLHGQVAAMRESQAVIEFDLAGTVLGANPKFLQLFGYSLAEVQGRHHSLFVAPGEIETAEYRQFWQGLAEGKYQAARFKRLNKAGESVWIQASYNPIFDLNNIPFKVVKFATDITSEIALLHDLKTLIDGNFGEIEAAVERFGTQASAALRTGSQAASHVQTMALNTEQLAASVDEISETMCRARIATDTAHAETAKANLATGRLAATSQSMGGIVQMIRTIAGKINLLALNATIESARAGDAGRGFAVVASEVKGLARQASQATDQIATEIDKLQSVADEVVAALTQIGSLIDVVLTFVTCTASAVEEQSTATRMMSADMLETTGKVSWMNENMAAMDDAVTHVATAMANTRHAARILAR